MLREEEKFKVERNKSVDRSTYYNENDKREIAPSTCIHLSSSHQVSLSDLA